MNVKTMEKKDASTDDGAVAHSKVAKTNDAKMRQILDGARAVFLADGFDGASMNDIARVAGVSKGTLYVYFDSKVTLFQALIRDDRRRQAEQLFQFDHDDDDIAEVLYRTATSMMLRLCSAEHVAHMRMVIGAAAKHPEIGRTFYEAGPQCGAAKVAAYMQRQMDAGRLRASDPQTMAVHFLQLSQGGYAKAVLFCVAEPGDLKEIERSAREAVDAFLHGYGGAAGKK
ncbi:AcrR family transcriptional regulator [Rhodoblastus acidophilus]|uniref:TetR/AcrR family transcriptional regulator n=1 Tax=Rhodoblastus acidophilus TaxID=1074 RepID=UPI00222594F4|nr:TetR/AcrR family transcriptional regulator [Rhodoblastus acidophilus]MCW2318364.1 AcrR family transcriptional regulator [Rhodoblastus acidophilus]